LRNDIKTGKKEERKKKRKIEEGRMKERTKKGTNF